MSTLLDADPERLVPAMDAFRLLAEAFHRADNSENWLNANEKAMRALLARLIHGKLDAICSGCRIDCEDPNLGNGGEIFDPSDFFDLNKIGLVPVHFWCNFDRSHQLDRIFDDATGDFHFNYVDEKYRRHEGVAFDVHFDREGLPPLALPESVLTIPNTNGLVRETTKSPPTKAGRGRRPANWWPDFAEELAHEIHQNGMPETQAALIKRVLDALAERGKPEPSRTQIQPIIRGLFDRLTSAGKS